MVERDKPGGRCLNYACIPAKTMLHTAEILDHAQNSADLGVTVKEASLDWKALSERRTKVSETLAGGVKMLWDKNKVAMIEGEGALDADGNVTVGSDTYEAGAVVLATGSVALAIPGPSSASGSSTHGAPGRCRSCRSGSPSSAPGPPALRSPPPTSATGRP